MTAIEERIEGHYEVREVPYGKVYRWGSGQALVECACGQLMITEEGVAACSRCGANYKGAVGELVGRLPEQEENRCPEHQEREEWLEDEEARSEYHECLFSGLFSGLKVTEDLNQLLDEFYEAILSSLERTGRRAADRPLPPIGGEIAEEDR